MNATALAHNLEETLQNATPAMKQYFQLKAQYPESLLFYRMGDFYELFFDDAVIASDILNIALTKRGKHGDQEIPMCGVPAHSHESYLQKLIASGQKVAVCEQLETPEQAKKARGHKAVVQRDVVRVITPGTITEDSLLDAQRANYLAAAYVKKDRAALGWVDISTGSFYLLTCPAPQLQEELLRLQPQECLISLNDTQLEASLQAERLTLSPQPESWFSSSKGSERLKDYYQLAVLDSLGELSEVELGVCAALLEYLALTQKATMPRLDRPQKIGRHDRLALDIATRRNLELLQTLDGQRKGSLLHAMDRTVTGAGGRLLASRLSSPLTDASAINKRLQQVNFFLENPLLRKELRNILRQCPDMERAVSRLSMERGGPRDMLMVVKALEAALQIRTHFANLDLTTAPEGISGYSKTLQDHAPLREELSRALKEDPPMLTRDGNFIARGYHATLDEFRHLRDESRQHIAQLQKKYQELTGIGQLKIKFNHVLGYFVEITPTHQAKMTDHFVHRQTMKNALRYSSKELAELEHKIREAADKSLKLELEIFEQLLSTIKAEAESLQLTARCIAGLDVSCALAELAEEQHYCLPEIDDSLRFEITQGRHPVVEQQLKKQQEAFIANPCRLSEDDAASAKTEPLLWLITGPNMAGKSTFLRQNALIAIMAQMGSFVPATSARIGLVDRVFSRVGAADDLARGRSTFMVEMVETATILHHASERSLVILDEIGRGTATYDGLSLAWSVVEHLHNHSHCRGLFATHYHELTRLHESLTRLRNYHVQVKEWKGQVVFLHTLAQGAANRSYGIHVARLAGMPEHVIQRAEALLKTLEQQTSPTDTHQLAETMPLFHYSHALEPQAAEGDETSRAIIKILQDTKPDELTPRDALNLLYQLKSL
jgi:DNA mismatch repair protein MutS